MVKPDLAEWAYGEYEGLTSEQIQQDDPDWTIWTGGGAGPGGESAADVEERLDRVIDEARPLLEVGDVAFVAHGHSRLQAAAAAGCASPPARDGCSPSRPPRSRLWDSSTAARRSPCGI
ncbi:hypothetical protein GCM10029992_67060 [Glycomyces albus]